MTSELNRCDWCLGDGEYLAYHDEEWGRPLWDEQKLFEFLLLEGAQAGLSWITVLRKRENYRKAYDQFDIQKMARYSDKRVEKLLGNEGIIRNRLKVRSAINNAQRVLALYDAGTTLKDTVWQFVEGQPIQNRFKTLAEVPASTEVSDKMSKELKRLGFNFVGSTICYAYMQATGMVNDHLVSCHCHEPCRQLAP